MNGKIVLCFAVIFVGQAMSAATGSTMLEMDDIKKVADQFSQSAVSLSNHILQGVSPSTAEAQKSVEKVRGLITKGFTDVETEAYKMKEIVLKNADPKLAERYNEFEKDLKKYFFSIKETVEEKLKPLGEKVEMKKLADNLVKSTKEMEANLNKAIDSFKKQ